MKRFAFTLVVLTGFACGLAAERGKVLYQNDFEKSDLDKVPEDLMVLEGGFAVKEEEGNKFLELPETPLDTYGVLFGPTEKGGLAVSARIYGSSTGRRFPTFGVGVNGQAGYRLQVSPAKKELELYKGETLKNKVPYQWVAGKWTVLELRTRRIDSTGWRVEGKAWTQGDPDPGWMISADEPEGPQPGRASIWGSPFSGKPIRFDDLSVTEVGTQ